MILRASNNFFLYTAWLTVYILLQLFESQQQMYQNLEQKDKEGKEGKIRQENDLWRIFFATALSMSPP